MYVEKFTDDDDGTVEHQRFVRLAYEDNVGSSGEAIEMAEAFTHGLAARALAFFSNVR